MIAGVNRPLAETSPDLRIAPSVADAKPPTLGERISRLADEELRILGAGVGDHLAPELAERAAGLRAERRALERLHGAAT